MNWWIKLGCKLTGWSSEVLSQCSEASRCQLNKYTSALLILILIWGVTGFCFAQRYIGLPVWACGFVSLFFITIVVMIERQIILANSKTMVMLAFRIVIALIMAIVGSTIFDQTMFGKDIDKQMTNTIAILQADINDHPFVIQTSVTNSQSKILMPDGTLATVNNPSKTTTQVANPKQSILEANNNTVKGLREQEQSWTQKKQNVEEDVRKECKESVGFLEELEAMWTIITTRPLAGAFYAVFFALLMSLELFVVFSKLFDKECDYETAIRGAQKVRIAQFANLYNRINVQSA